MSILFATIILCSLFVCVCIGIRELYFAYAMCKADNARYVCKVTGEAYDNAYTEYMQHRGYK